MSIERMPRAEVEVGADLVRCLLASQHPDLSSERLVEVGSGWDNAIFRLGDGLVVRLPRRSLAAVLVEHEQRWLPALAPCLPLPIPVPVRVGGPGCGFPWSWSVCAWLPGRAAAIDSPYDPVAAAQCLGEFLVALHRPAPSDAPRNPFRGVPLAERSDGTLARVVQLGGLIDRGAVVALWEELVATPQWSGPPLWLHGDLHPANLLVDRGRLSAVIDFGDITSGDPAVDLAVAWMLFAPEARDVFRDAAGRGHDDDTWDRARGWALALSLAYLAHSADNPVMARIGRRILEALLRRPGG